MLERIFEDEAFLKQICFSDDATFHISRKLNTHNVRIWGSEHPHVIRELQRNSPKVNVWRGIISNRMIGSFFFPEATINADVYFDLLSEYVAPQLIDVQPIIIFQQDGAPLHWGCVFVNSSMKHFQTDGLEEMDQFHGHHVHLTSLPWNSFCGFT